MPMANGTGASCTNTKHSQVGKSAKAHSPGSRGAWPAARIRNALHMRSRSGPGPGTNPRGCGRCVVFWGAMEAASGRGAGGPGFAGGASPGPRAELKAAPARRGGARRTMAMRSMRRPAAGPSSSTRVSGGAYRGVWWWWGARGGVCLCGKEGEGRAPAVRLLWLWLSGTLHR